MILKLNPNLIFNHTNQADLTIENREGKKMNNSDKLEENMTDYFIFNYNFLRAALKAGKMPMTQFQVLRMLLKNGKMRTGEISDRLSISRPNLTPVIDKLVQLHYVERHVAKLDRRANDIIITEQGIEAIESEYRVVIERILNYTSKFSAEKKEKIAAAFKELALIFG